MPLCILSIDFERASQQHIYMFCAEDAALQSDCLLQLEEEFRKDINFVALNIDNTKWTSEVQQYRVRGVPHFVFLDSQAKQKTAAVGRVPQQVRAGC